MRKLFKHESLLIEGRFFWGSLVLVSILGTLLFRLWFLQVYRGDYYRTVSEANRVRRIEIPAPRGYVFDRNGQVLLGNRPFFDLVLIPQYVRDTETTIKVLSRLLHLPTASLQRRLVQGQGRPPFFPIVLKRSLSIHEVSTIETNRVFLPGVEVMMVPRRDYSNATPSHLVGYLGEIDRTMLKRFNEKERTNPYVPGDLVGRQGLEARWESHLRGKRGYRFVQVDANGRETDAAELNLGTLPTVPAQTGASLILTIDEELQNAAQQAFKGKYGAVVALRPSDGQILAIVSEPGYDPTLMQDGLSSEEWRSLLNNPYHPLLDKTTGGEYPPGSVYKAVVAIAALEEGVARSSTTHNCPGSFVIGDRPFHCHERGGHGIVDLIEAMAKSCDVYFYHLGVELGVDRIAKYAKMLGLGTRLGVELNMEKPGLVPTMAWKLDRFKIPWLIGETPPISIGQGYNKITPIQMAALYAALANGGKVWRPYLVQKVVNSTGETIAEVEPKLVTEASSIRPETYAIIRKSLMEVVQGEEGTGKKSRVQGATVAGKTGTVQVVSLSRTQNQVEDVSMKWREHAMFAAFSPADGAEIVVAIISENDMTGGGGASAAPVAGQIIQAYWDLKAKRAALAQRGPASGEQTSQGSENGAVVRQ